MRGDLLPGSERNRATSRALGREDTRVRRRMKLETRGAVVGDRCGGAFSVIHSRPFPPRAEIHLTTSRRANCGAIVIHRRLLRRYGLGSRGGSPVDLDAGARPRRAAPSAASFEERIARGPRGSLPGALVGDVLPGARCVDIDAQGMHHEAVEDGTGDGGVAETGARGAHRDGGVERGRGARGVAGERAGRWLCGCGFCRCRSARCRRGRPCIE